VVVAVAAESGAVDVDVTGRRVRLDQSYLSPAQGRDGLAHGYAVTGHIAQGQLRRRLVAGVNWVSHLLQAIAAALLADPATARRLAEARAAYARRAARLEAALRREGIATAGPTDGWNVWVPLAGEETHVIEELARTGWQVRPGSGDAVDPARSRQALRVTTSTMSERDAERFAGALAGVLRDVAR
jgi:DNA-binding transcriptional MocR family regulator